MDNMNTDKQTAEKVVEADRITNKGLGSNWCCHVCAWKGIDLISLEAVEFHKRFHSKQGTLCAGDLWHDDEELPNPVEADKNSGIAISGVPQDTPKWEDPVAVKVIARLEREKTELKLARDNTALLLREAINKLEIAKLALQIIERELMLGEIEKAEIATGLILQKLSTPLDGLAGKKEDVK